MPRVIESYDGEPVSLELPPLLLRLRDAVLAAAPTEVVAQALRDVLQFLASEKGRTNANCWAADLFCMEDENWDERRWEHLPPEMGDILGDMASALHDSVRDPDIARNFDSTPEQLLDRLDQFSSAQRLSNERCS